MGGAKLLSEPMSWICSKGTRLEPAADCELQPGCELLPEQQVVQSLQQSSWHAAMDLYRTMCLNQGAMHCSTVECKQAGCDCNYSQALKRTVPLISFSTLLA